MNRPIHPLFVASFPVLFLIQHNLYRMTARDGLVPLAATIAAVAVLLVVGEFVFHRVKKTALMVSLIAALFFSYGHVYDLAVQRGVSNRELILLILWGAAAGSGIYAIVRTKRKLDDLARVLNIAGATLVVMALVSLGTNIAHSASVLQPAPAGAAVAAGSAAGGHRPDIYYFIFDRYAGEKTLKDVYGFDNTPFLDGLAERGFYVADKARTNYPNTSMSLASSLNYDYLDKLGKVVGPGVGSLAPAFQAIKYNGVARYLKARGYRYLHMGSWWDPTAANPNADVNIVLDPVSEFSRVLYSSTAMRPLLERSVIGKIEAELIPIHRLVARKQFARIGNLHRARGPKFVFAHILMPHPPYVLDRDGRTVDMGLDRENRRKDIGGYNEQLVYTNKQILKMVDRLQSGPKDRQPVIVIQSDEGPHPLVLENGKEIPKEWVNRPDVMYGEKFRILNAYYLPGKPDAPLYERISPANSFRVIFNQYFGANLPLLPDDSYVMKGLDDLFTFVKVTNRVHF